MCKNIKNIFLKIAPSITGDKLIKINMKSHIQVIVSSFYSYITRNRYNLIIIFNAVNLSNLERYTLLGRLLTMLE